MSQWPLSDIVSKVRKLTGRLSPNMMSDATIEDYINKVYLDVMPNDMKTLQLVQPYWFTTVPGVDTYTMPDTLISVSPTAYVDGLTLQWYQDPDLFYNMFPEQLDEFAIGTGDGFTKAFSGVLTSQIPVVPGTVNINGGVEALTDTNNDGVLSSPQGGTGSINYLVGSYFATFFTAPVSGATVNIKYQISNPTRPIAILFDNLNGPAKFILRYVPDDVYQIRMNARYQPTAILSSSDTAQSDDWGPLLAYYAAIEIFADGGELDQIAAINDQFERYKSITISKTIERMGNSRAIPSI